MWFELVLSGLACYRLSYMLTGEDGPFDIFYRLRNVTGIVYSASGKVISYPNWNPLHCIHCTSIYVAAMITGLLYAYGHPVSLAFFLSVSTLAILVDAMVNYGK